MTVVGCLPKGYPHPEDHDKPIILDIVYENDKNWLSANVVNTGKRTE